MQRESRNSRSTRRRACWARSARVFFSRLPFLAAVTLAVFIPGKLVAQLVVRTRSTCRRRESRRTC